MRRRDLLILSPLALAACQLASGGKPRLTVGAPYRWNGVWFYPQTRFVLNETGLGMAYRATGWTTADGEAFDANAMAAAHPTLQLPAIGRVTNLETGLSVLVRINDRGPPDTHRFLGVTRRVAEVLGATDMGAIRLRLTLDRALSEQLATGLTPPPRVPVKLAPLGAVTTAALPPPPGVGQGQGAAAARPRPLPAAAPAAAPMPVPLRLAETLLRSAPSPGNLFVSCGALGSLAAASALQDRVRALGARIVVDQLAPATRAYRVMIGPLGDVRGADALLDHARALGAAGSRITIE